ncbi:hypothetical protein [Pectobacterium brasiliense]|uniref:hypothetical protein n=1 Tax=Pectobacterium brasiliense TaxID=180957 RepID=UPI001968EB51|nr:hypothetical protein [Pectobacterium brasiliense]MBN3162768.1 hypothetical protein [Pectobacterium brasiliense]
MITLGTIISQASTNTGSPLSPSTDGALKIDSTLTQTINDNKSSSVTGIKVELSEAGLKKASEDNKTNPNKDIDESGLPEKAKQILKIIRQVQKMIEEKQAEIQKLMDDKTQDPESKQNKLKALQTALSTLISSLAKAIKSLDDLEKDKTLSPEQAQQASMLMMKGAKS